MFSIKEQAFSQYGLDVADSLSVCCEVSGKCLANLEEEILDQNIRERTCNVGVVLDPAKAGFDVIGMDNDVGIWEHDAEIIQADEDFFLYHSKFALEIGVVSCGCHGVDGY